MNKIIAIDTPLAEISLRKYEKPENLKDRDLVRKLCLSVGLLQPGDSRDIIVDILYVVLKAKEPLTSMDIENNVIEFRKHNNLPLQGIASSNIRRQLLRLRDIFLVEKLKNSYRINENSKLFELFVEKIEKYYLNSIVERVKDYINEADVRFPRQ
ncbi:TPA: hypothetical protein HA235_04780 [Candidatus Woesearchaeota archaeon]|nr:hypothetical protein [Candidatus Woesearchaeota archaeon]HIH54769.1 hypothetical protein [Candidatus Woesearchaeota archaeon]HIJ14758.1 hypothetical protein [Candidatus Woesearchaeota archaeon]